MKDLLRILLPEHRKQLGFAVALCLVAGLIAFIWDQRASESTAAKPEAESVQEAATYIPEGYVLVPIEVANFESLDSILGKFGVVDLFVGSEDPRVRPRKLAERVKILRAPLNPNHFAVLVPDNESQKIVAYSGALTVVVQNPNKSGPTLVKPDSTRPRSRPSRVIVEVSNAF
jgi:hypothetical protein